MNTKLYFAALRELECLRGHLRIHGGPHEWADEIIRRFTKAVTETDNAVPPDDEVMYLGADPLETEPPQPAA
ncbi:MAG: hypothetical protein ACRELF_20060 [Gemmataceae bacterium]